MIAQWKSGFAAIGVTLVAAVLIILDIVDRPVRHWWLRHALTTDTVAGLLVLLITVLVADQVTGLRRRNDRSRAVAAQAAIVLAQALRTTGAVSDLFDGSGSHDDALSEVRNYATMLLVSAPVLIDARNSRAFLEQAQSLGGEIARLIRQFTKDPSSASASRPRLDDAVERLRATSTPLLSSLEVEQPPFWSDRPT